MRHSHLDPRIRTHLSSLHYSLKKCSSSRQRSLLMPLALSPFFCFSAKPLKARLIPGIVTPSKIACRNALQTSSAKGGRQRWSAIFDVKKSLPRSSFFHAPRQFIWSFFDVRFRVQFTVQTWLTIHSSRLSRITIDGSLIWVRNWR